MGRPLAADVLLAGLEREDEPPPAIRVRLSDTSEADALLDSDAYRERLASESSE